MNVLKTLIIVIKFASTLTGAMFVLVMMAMHYLAIEEPVEVGTCTICDLCIQDKSIQVKPDIVTNKWVGTSVTLIRLC